MPSRLATVMQPLLWPAMALLQFGWIIWPQLGLMLGMANLGFLLAIAVAWLLRRSPFSKG
jgi:hypothetical protein